MSRETLFDFYRLFLILGLVLFPRVLGYGSEWFFENRPVELIQVAHLAVATIMAAAATSIAFRRGDAGGWIAFLLALSLAWFTDRELDGIWEQTSFSVRFLSNRVILVFLFGFAVACRLSQILILLPWQLQASYFRTFAVAVTGYIGAQLFDPFGNFLGMSHETKQITEESLELYFGSYFLFCSIELLMLHLPRRPFARASFREASEGDDGAVVQPHR